MKNAVCTTSNLNEGDESHVLKWIKSLHCFETSKILYALTSSGSSLLDYLLEIIKDKVDVEEFCKTSFEKIYNCFIIEENENIKNVVKELKILEDDKNIGSVFIKAFREACENLKSG